MTLRHGLTFRGHDVEVEPLDGWQSGLRLRVDGETVAERRTSTRRLRLQGGDVEVAAWMSPWGRVRTADLVLGDGERLPLEPRPEPGTLAARLVAFGERHPRLWASRHAVAGVANAVMLFVGLGFLLRLLPAVPLPSVDLPDVPWPDLPDLVDLPALPDLLSLPAWLADLALPAKAAGVVLFGVALAVVEHRRHRRIRARRERAERHAGETER
jgi:hypothetical protein